VGKFYEWALDLAFMNHGVSATMIVIIDPLRLAPMFGPDPRHDPHAAAEMGWHGGSVIIGRTDLAGSLPPLGRPCWGSSISMPALSGWRVGVLLFLTALDMFCFGSPDQTAAKAMPSG